MLEWLMECFVIMMRRMVLVGLLVAALGLSALGVAALGQRGSRSSGGGDASSQNGGSVLDDLSRGQRGEFNAAVQSFRGEQYADALVGFKKLLAELKPGLAVTGMIEKFAAESAINTGDRDYALGLLKPMEIANSQDWQAESLLARIYAETGQYEKRDAELKYLKILHANRTGQFSKLTQILLERIVLPAGTSASSAGSVRIWYSLTPWGPYKTYLYARIYDAAGQESSKVALESADFDQASFAKEKPELAAKGERRFSLDGYGEPVRLANGQMQNATYAFFDGEPAYGLVRDEIVAIAEGKGKAISSMQTTK
jgi:hypothetical protein